MDKKHPIKSTWSFSLKYDETFAERYHRSREESPLRRWASQQEVRMARRSLELAGNPRSVLDIPCGTGRFWPMLAADPERVLLAADSSQAMIDTALRLQPAVVTERFRTLQTDAFAIDLPDDAVENVFCMRLVHHLHEPEARIRLYRELARVSSRTVCVSLRVSGNFSAWRRHRRHRALSKTEINRNVLTPTQAAGELAQAGLQVVGYVDLLPYYSMWRSYVARVHRA
jgi:ubiquinone/menaquinone biosynthesis C-methylase UbiE